MAQPNRVRIIAGRFKNRWLNCPRGRTVRPTTDRVREATFSMLGPGACEARVVLDPFAGTGALGLEALSRGADRVVFCEDDERVVRTLERNIQALAAGKETAVLPGNCFDQGDRLRLLGPFDLVLLDPPYEAMKLGTFFADLTRFLGTPELLAQSCTIVMEHPTKGVAGDIPPVLVGAEQVRQRRYGNVSVAIYER